MKTYTRFGDWLILDFRMFYHILWYSCKNVTKGSSFREDVCIFWRPAHLGFSDVLSYFIIFLKNITKGLSFREDVCTFSFIILAKCHVSHKLCSMYRKLCSVYSKSCSMYSFFWKPARCHNSSSNHRPMIVFSNSQDICRFIMSSKFYGPPTVH